MHIKYIGQALKVKIKSIIFICLVVADVFAFIIRTELITLIINQIIITIADSKKFKLVSIIPLKFCYYLID